MHQPRQTTFVFPGPCEQLQLVHDLLWRGRQNRVQLSMCEVTKAWINDDYR